MGNPLSGFMRTVTPQQPTGSGQPTAATQMINASPQMASMPQPTPDPYAQAGAAVQQRFPRLRNIPLHVTTGSGPYESEVYQPWQSDNPNQGKFTVQLRSDKSKSLRGQMLQDSIAAESFHHLGALKPNGQPVDPAWWQLKQQFRQTLSPRDLELAEQHWQEEQKSGEKRSFDQFLNQSYLDMFVRGYIFPQSQGQEWVDRQGKWPANQAAVLEKMKGLLQQQ